MKKLVFTVMMVLIVMSGCGREKATALVNEEEICGQGEGCTLEKESYVGFDVGDQIPNLTLIDKDGKEQKLYDMVAGKDKFVLSLTADWCTDCYRQDKKLNEYYSSLEAKKYGAAVVLINYSSSDGTKTTNEEQMLDFIEQENYQFPIFYDKDGAIVEQYGKVYAVPFNFVLDENAIIKAKTTEIDMDNLLLENSEKSRI